MGNIEQDSNFVARNRTVFKDAYRGFYTALGFTHVLTLAWNCNARLEAARDDLRRLHARVDETLLGRRYYRLPNSERTLAMFAFESVSYNLHAHSLWRIPKGPEGANRILRFHRMFPEERGGVWNEVVASGSYKLTVINDLAAISYVLKEQHMGADDQTVVWSTDFGRAQ